ncbi:hypothetical protein [Lacinutrix jangbogonensis]|uniref:hypothetical protein n=1 Tax=Lacinutrix jangbogonensis TaxID=1469557 RepID=UPI00053E171E|nr:hypothetical protein [Lacinutrix jangbogonensis]
MKTLFKTLLLLTCITSCNISFGQDSASIESKTTSRRNINFNEKDTQKRESILKVLMGTDQLEIAIRGELTAGKLVIEIYDSNNTKRERFTVENIVDTKKNLNGHSKKNDETVLGEITKKFSSPIYGEWIVKITTTNAVGTLGIYYISKKLFKKD